MLLGKTGCWEVEGKKEATFSSPTPRLGKESKNPEFSWAMFLREKDLGSGPGKQPGIEAQVHPCQWIS